MAKPVADLDALHRLDPERGGGEPGVETQARLGVRAQPRRHPERTNLEQAAEGVAVDPRRIDRLDHAARRLVVRAADLARHRAIEGLLVTGVGRRLDVADPDDPAAHAHLAESEERLRERPRGDACGGLARRGALEHVADVVVAELQRAREVGVPRPREHDGPRTAGSDLGELVLGDGPGAHRRAPVHVIAVADDQRDRPAERAPVTESAQDLGIVTLDLLARAAPVAGLPAGEVAAERLAIDLEARWQARDDGGDSRPVGFA